MSTTVNLAKRNARTARRLSALVVVMFGFGYALVPLYDVLCDITGLGGRTGVVQAAALDGLVDETRLVTVQFDGTVNSALPWEFRPATPRMQVHPGKVYEARYVVRNLSSRTTVGMATPSVVPSVASLYFNKTMCFCFEKQRFDAGEEREVFVKFVISKELPEEHQTLTLSYTFFNVDART